jgi:predicted DNA-binding transcriptional regulator AlpA
MSLSVKTHAWANYFGAKQMVERVEPRKVLRESELPTYDGLQKTQRAELIKQDRYPKPVRLSARRKAWFADEIALWQQQRIAAKQD